MNHVVIHPLTQRMIHLHHQTISIYLPHHINTYNGLRIYYPDLYSIIKEQEEEQKNYILDRTEWIID